MPIPSGHTRFERKSLRETATEQIRTAIFDGTLEAGESLNDQDLQDWLGVSRTPIREALNDLARVGLIEMAPQRYTRVARPGQEDRLLVLQTLGALVGGMVRITVPELDAEGVARLVDEIDEVVVRVDARDALGHGRQSWHLVDEFISACPNPVLVTATRDQIDGLAYRLSVTIGGEGTDWGALETGYSRLREAIVAGDAVAAELAIETVFQL
ncbi:GntR family transcriptional regulator [Plantibacter sp. YIM 135249]|uniref:GntR family transcriptional regulator n=1 Tax=Plantibacter sp. YIM 135249 TaxID=3423918 RepID=UPI003D35566E